MSIQARERFHREQIYHLVGPYNEAIMHYNPGKIKACEQRLKKIDQKISAFHDEWTLTLYNKIHRAFERAMAWLYTLLARGYETRPYQFEDAIQRVHRQEARLIRFENKLDPSLLQLLDEKTRIKAIYQSYLRDADRFLCLKKEIAYHRTMWMRLSYF